ncbi:hypothetical protein EVAR_93807_1 [Eumeta japonica]|uniref:Uncharacterized protein n=1 Tax=Eumeta variegata TaxID=151549 RepID=A0A4C1VDT8_EUMVA|nr:hypothetical protein EVAR_93807_1 [Eumeta japonica]
MKEVSSVHLPAHSRLRVAAAVIKFTVVEPCCCQFGYITKVGRSSNEMSYSHRIRREVTASAITFRPAKESSSGPFPLHRPILPATTSILLPRAHSYFLRHPIPIQETSTLTRDYSGVASIYGPQ